MEKNLRGFKNIVDILIIAIGMIGIVAGFILNAVTITAVRLSTDIIIKSPFAIVSFISIFLAIIGFISVMQDNQN